ncbi:hypothetical protein [Actinocatenispora rupis]|uniref:Uncharacterized protein n=1 Tax=Actinocatenispora rupis TaxID=519421 RepID=A0A8J3IWS8_9ACTN|nr:hypothetical protein [Actinocatenispora rupis]GID10080.1 hypothetical protein Aru02nite_09690 [Actinocatenispora rupis]
MDTIRSVLRALVPRSGTGIKLALVTLGIVGSLAILAPTLSYRPDRGYVPTCDDAPMEPDEICTTLSSSGTRTDTYYELVAAHERQARFEHRVQVVLFAAGIPVAVLFGACTVLAERHDRRPRNPRRPAR